MQFNSKYLTVKLAMGLFVAPVVAMGYNHSARQVSSIGEDCPDNFKPSIALGVGNTNYWAAIPRDGQVHYFGNTICMAGDSSSAYCFNCIDIHEIDHIYIPGNMNPCMIVANVVQGAGAMELQGLLTGDEGEDQWVDCSQDGTVQGVICGLSEE